MASCSKTNASERAMVIGLGALNLFGVVVLGTMLKYGSVELLFFANCLTLYSNTLSYFTLFSGK